MSLSDIVLLLDSETIEIANNIIDKTIFCRSTDNKKRVSHFLRFKNSKKKISRTFFNIWKNRFNVSKEELINVQIC
jgi:hypothetical protein